MGPFSGPSRPTRSLAGRPPCSHPSPGGLTVAATRTFRQSGLAPRALGGLSSPTAGLHSEPAPPLRQTELSGKPEPTGQLKEPSRATAGASKARIHGAQLGAGAAGLDSGGRRLRQNVPHCDLETARLLLWGRPGLRSHGLS